MSDETRFTNLYMVGCDGRKPVAGSVVFAESGPVYEDEDGVRFPMPMFPSPSTPEEPT